jgi:hypothetical protein
LQVTRVILVLMASFGLVLIGAIAMIMMHRRQLRQWRRQNRLVDQLSQITSARRRLIPFPLPTRWLAIKSSNTTHLRAALALRGPVVSWAEAMSRARERTLFLSQPVDGWTLVVGGALPDPTADIDALYRFLVELSRETGEVQFFSLDRVLGFHGWARLRDGRVLRGYAWAGDVLWNEGRVTLDERLLGLRTLEYGEEAGPVAYGEIRFETTNAERVPLLARRWGVDLATATEVLLQQEGVESDE